MVEAEMTIAQALKSAQYVVSATGQPTGVLLSVEAWETFLNMLEDVIDARIAREALSELRAANGRPEQAGWLEWDEIEAEWNGEEVETAAV